MSRLAIVALLLACAVPSAAGQRPTPPTDAAEIVYNGGDNGIKSPIPIHYPEAQSP